MVNVDFVNINNATLIGRLLPFWARGRKTSLFLQAILHPIISAHNNFKSWALERFIECHITAQRSSLEWYLKHKLKQHFLNEEDVFYIADGIDRTICCFSNNVWTNELPWDNQMRWSLDVEPLIDINYTYSCINSGKWRDERLWQEHLPWVNEPEGDEEAEENYFQLMDGIIVYAPAIVNTINYDAEDYERDIRYIMSKYMVCFKKVNIIIANTNKKVINMKIHNYGNDYAFQHRQKKDAEKQAPVLQIVNPQDELTENVEHQIQTEGEAAMAAAVNQSVESEREELPAAEKSPKKKKKEERRNLRHQVRAGRKLSSRIQP